MQVSLTSNSAQSSQPSAVPHVLAWGRSQRSHGRTRPSRGRPIPPLIWLNTWMWMWLWSLAPTALLAGALALTLLAASMAARAQGSDPMRPLNATLNATVSATPGTLNGKASASARAGSAAAPVTPSALTGLAHDTSTPAARARGLMAILAGPDGRWMAWFEDRWVRAGDRIGDTPGEAPAPLAATLAVVADVGPNELVIVQGQRRTTLQLLPLPLALATPTSTAPAKPAPHTPRGTAQGTLIGPATSPPPNPQQLAARWRRETP